MVKIDVRKVPMERFGGIFAVGDEETNEEDKARVVNAYIY